MKPINYLSKSQKETIHFGKRLAGSLKKGDIVCLFGDLGSGKTMLTKGIAQGLKINQNKVSSPSFVFLNIYEGKVPLYHFDLYRIEHRREIFSLGCEEYFYGEGISVIEWAERLQTLLPKEYWSVHLSIKKDNERLLKLTAKGQRERKAFSALKK